MTAPAPAPETALTPGATLARDPGTTAARTTTTVARRRRRQRIVAGVRLTGLRVGLRILEVVAPEAAGRRAFALWCTLPDNAGRRKDNRPAGGAITAVAVPRGGSVTVESWGEGPPVYLVHGWGGWRGQLGAFVQPLVDAGFTAVAFDAPSHGDSEPGAMGSGRGTLIEFIEALEEIGKVHGHAAGVIAHSMGCTAAAMVLRASLTSDRLVLVAPNHDFEEITQAFATALRLSDRTLSNLHRAVEQLAERPISAFHLEPLGVDGGLPETLVVHDRDDKETPYAVSLGLAAAWPRATLVTTDGLGHQRILTDPETVRRVVAYVTAGRVAVPVSAEGVTDTPGVHL